MANSRIHTGFWVDHSRHPVIGATITLESSWGQNLISAATVVVQIIGVSTWVIAAYLIHQRRSISGLRDEFDAQLQVLLRNCVSPDGTAWEIFSLGHTWKGRRREIWKTVGWICGLSTLIYTGFLVAGIFVGQISSSSYESINVLIEPSSCGFININAGSEGHSGFSAIGVNVSTNAQQYARSCYGGGSLASPVSCSVYPVEALNYTVETHDQTCPIPGGSACFKDDELAAPITLRTNKVDSHRDLGINAPQEDRLSVQYETTCAPLDYDFVDDFVFTANLTYNDTRFYPGSQNATVDLYGLGPWSQTDFSSNYTFTYSPSVRHAGLGVVGYAVSSYKSFSPHKNGLSLWTPIAPFNESIGDLSLITVMPNSITFTQPVQDPMFRTFDDPDGTIYGGAQYVPKRDVYLLACTEKWNLCNTRNGKCTDWDTALDLLDIQRWVDTLNLSPAQNATYNRVVDALFVSTMNSAVFGVPQPLLAGYSLLSQTGSQPLPDGHWRREVEGWFQSVLAKWQFLPSVFPNVPLGILRDNDVEFLPASDLGPEMERQCHQQRVTSPQKYQSYNFFALVFIAFMGLLVPGIALAIKRTHRFREGKMEDHRYFSYQAEGLLQLHRMALENAGYDDWEEGIQDKPRTQFARRRLPQATLVRESTDRQPMLRYPRHGTIYEGDGDSDASKANGYHAVPKGDAD